MIASMNPAIHTAAHLVTLRVLQSLAEGTLVAVFAALVLARTRYNSGTRFAVWFSSLIAIAVVPIITVEWLWSEQSALGQPAVTVPDSWALYFFGACERDLVPRRARHAGLVMPRFWGLGSRQIGYKRKIGSPQ